jgi:MoaA/NifB/PqqE/SkfB family radical SAM enzyme
MPNYWESLTRVKGSFQKVVSNIKKSLDKTITSITCTVTHQNLDHLSKFVDFCNAEFPGLYATFFSVYKGNNPEFAFTHEDVDKFMHEIKPQLEAKLQPESLALLQETVDEKTRLMQSVRFPENSNTPCYIHLSERVYDWEKETSCSHLYRDRVFTNEVPHQKCLYGCNRKLVAFNQEVHKILKNS